MDLEQLKYLSELKYQHSQQALSEILQRERSLRAELLRLRSLMRETQTQPSDQAQMRMIGGDVIWMKWIAQAQRKLNIELAQVLAQKEAYMQRHRRAHGRKIMAEHLSVQDVELRRQAKRKTQLDQAIENSILR